jgi:hypothetical protein
VRVLTELIMLHYRPRGSKQKAIKARWEEGLGNAYMGYLPSWLLLRAAYRGLVEKPPIVGGFVLLAGYIWARVRRLPRIDDPDAIAELRSEQRARMTRLFRRGGTAQLAAPDEGGPAYWSTSPNER